MIDEDSYRFKLAVQCLVQCTAGGRRWDMHLQTVAAVLGPHSIARRVISTTRQAFYRAAWQHGIAVQNVSKPSTEGEVKEIKEVDLRSPWQ
jgi:hypothetical protein